MDLKVWNVYQTPWFHSFCSQTGWSCYQPDPIRRVSGKRKKNQRRGKKNQGRGNQKRPEDFNKKKHGNTESASQALEEENTDSDVAIEELLDDDDELDDGALGEGYAKANTSGDCSWGGTESQQSTQVVFLPFPHSALWWYVQHWSVKSLCFTHCFFLSWNYYLACQRGIGNDRRESKCVTASISPGFFFFRISQSSHLLNKHL